jgi:tetratricopeptide (TPR) repeat protein
MPRKSSILINGVLLLGFGLLADAHPAYAANRKKELAKQALAAEASGDFEQAETAYCELLKEDKKNKTAKAKCEEYSQRNQQLHTKDADAMAAGKSALAERRFQDAIHAFQTVTSKRFHDEASRYLTTVIPEAQKAFVAEQQARQREEEARNADNLKRGTEAYQRNDFETSKALLTRVTGPSSVPARRVLQDINRYTTEFEEAFKLEKAGKYKQAAERYRQVLKIKADGPWEIGRKLAHMQQQLKAAAAPPAQPGSAATEVPSPEDRGLAQAIEDFYRGEFQQAAGKLASYPGEGPRRALAMFYLGACELSVYYLAPAGNAPKEVYERAVEHFRAARQIVPTFTPPEQYVSPRVLKVFSESAP